MSDDDLPFNPLQDDESLGRELREISLLVRCREYALDDSLIIRPTASGSWIAAIQPVSVVGSTLEEALKRCRESFTTYRAEREKM